MVVMNNGHGDDGVGSRGGKGGPRFCLLSFKPSSWLDKEHIAIVPNY